jgi:hypothetical protein
MKVDSELEAGILKEVGPSIDSDATTSLVAAAGNIIDELVVTNFQNSTMAGDQGIHPTNDDMAASKVETAAHETEGKVAQDTVAGVNGEVKASETEARAVTGEATAADSGASALRTKAGASDIETKALKMT